YLARHVAVDGGKARLDPLGRDVVQPDLVAGKGRDMRDAAAHLAGADDAYRRDSARHPTNIPSWRRNRRASFLLQRKINGRGGLSTPAIAILAYLAKSVKAPFRVPAGW